MNLHLYPSNEFVMDMLLYLLTFVDIIGNVVSYGNCDVYNNRNGKEQKRMTLELQDLEYDALSL